MTHIFAFGGGEIGRTKLLDDGTVRQYPIETMHIDAEIIKLSGKTNPNLLFIGTASGDAESYSTAVQNHFGGRLGCVISELKLVDEAPKTSEIQGLVDNADIIYVGGGDTRAMLDIWRRTGTDEILKSAWRAGKIISGTSAGAICWFEWYDNLDYIDGDMTKLDLLPGLGLLTGFAVPHWDDLNDADKGFFVDMLEKNGISGWAIDNSAAVYAHDGVLTAMNGTNGRGARQI